MVAVYAIFGSAVLFWEEKKQKFFPALRSRLEEKN